jgi:peptidoglycan/xylan/chitin deacetylase (PgdA/CDA1 family)
VTRAIPLKRISRQLLSFITFYSGYCKFSEFLKLNSGVRILCFHGISDKPGNPYAVSTSDFSRQMGFLAEHYDIVSIDQLVTRVKDGKNLPPTMIAVSFDDGYQDFQKNAFPILQKNAITATVFLPTGSIDGNSKYRQVLPQGEFLSWDQVRELHMKGIDFGSHTVSHSSLTRLTQQETRYELETSKARIEAELHAPIKGFAYPYGTLRDTDPKIGGWISDSGYGWAVTSISGVNGSKSVPFALRRTVIVRDDGMAGFKRALKGALDGWVLMQKAGYYLERVTSMTKKAGCRSIPPIRN